MSDDRRNKKCPECGRPLTSSSPWCDEVCEHNWKATMRHFGVDPMTGRRQKSLPIQTIIDVQNALVAGTGYDVKRMILPMRSGTGEDE